MNNNDHPQYGCAKIAWPEPAGAKGYAPHATMPRPVRCRVRPSASSTPTPRIGGGWLTSPPLPRGDKFYVPALAGFVYLTIVLDVFSR